MMHISAAFKLGHKMDDSQHKLEAIQNLPLKLRLSALRNVWTDHTSPRYLYKYRRLDSDRSAATRLRDIIVGSNLWFSSPLDFNDPFDLSAKVFSDAPAKDKRARMKEILKSQKVSHKHLEPIVTKNMRDGGEKVEEYMLTHFNSYRDRVGVISLASEPKDILMWSHYAGDHTGICLQFEVAHDVPVFGNAIQVRYSGRYPTIDWVYSFPKDVQRTLLTKFDGWKYEKEYRIIEYEKVRTKLAYRPEALTAIIFGYRASEDTIKLVKSLINERPLSLMRKVRLYRAQLHKSEYKLKIYSL